LAFTSLVDDPRRSTRTRSRSPMRSRPFERASRACWAISPASWSRSIR